jgi:dTDP-4-amino-4,6-dideoxygalactose transaminase
LAKRYDELLSSLPLVTPWQHTDSYSGLHLYVIRLDLDKTSKSHRQVFEGLREQNIGVNVHYIPVHTQPFYTQIGFAVGDFPQAEKYYAEGISLPMYQDLTHAQQDQVVAALCQELSA